MAFLLPNPSGNQLGYDAIGTTFYGNVVTTRIAQTIRSLQADGKKVLLSFGGFDRDLRAIRHAGCKSAAARLEPRRIRE